MNPVTQAIAAAHAVAARAAANGTRRESVLRDIAADVAESLPALDAALGELTGDELLTLALAADVLAVRARAVETHRRNSAVTAEIAELKKRKQV